jgi:hypothetical protein
LTNKCEDKKDSENIFCYCVDARRAQSNFAYLKNILCMFDIATNKNDWIAREVLWIFQFQIFHHILRTKTVDEFCLCVFGANVKGREKNPKILHNVRTK